MKICLRLFLVTLFSNNMNMHYSKIFLKAMFGYFKEFLTKEMQ